MEAIFGDGPGQATHAVSSVEDSIQLLRSSIAGFETDHGTLALRETCQAQRNDLVSEMQKRVQPARPSLSDEVHDHEPRRERETKRLPQPVKPEVEPTAKRS